MNPDSGFEPFFDWDGITPEMSEDLRKDVLEYMSARDLLLKPDQGVPTTAARFMRAQHDLNVTCDAIMTTLYTVPMMVHVAGKKIRERDDDDEKDQIVQRCVRCGSMLHMWQEGYGIMTGDGPRPLEEDDVSWWEPGTRVAKASDEGTMTMYLIEDRDLEKYEKPCPDFASQLGGG